MGEESGEGKERGESEKGEKGTKTHFSTRIVPVAFIGFSMVHVPPV